MLPPHEGAGRRSTNRALRAYVQLVRLPAVFTAMADIFVGTALTQVWPWSPWPFAGLLASSSALYLAGMVLNDVFDRNVDARERPGRPIPSGRVSLKAAVALGLLLLAIGLFSAAAVSVASLKTAALLVVLILMYDGFAKSTPIGPLAMGACRLLNVLLGASLAPIEWQSPQVWIASSMGTYVAGVTWFARGEAGESSLAELGLGAILIDAGLFLLGVFIVQGPVGVVRAVGFAILAVVGASLQFQILSAIAQRSAERVQRAIKRLLLAIVLVDATIVYCATGNGALAVATAALVVPAVAIGRWIALT